MFTFDYIDSLAECWTREKLLKAAEQWPARPDWSWFCGARLAEYDEKRQLEVLSIAIAHATKQRYRLKRRPGVLYEWAKTADNDARLKIMSELGAELDALDKAHVLPAAVAAESE